MIRAFLAVSVVAVVVTFGVAMVAPQDGTAYTEFALLTESDSGRYVAADYPSELHPGETRELVFSVQNHETEPVSYTVIVVLRQGEAAADSSGEEASTVQRTRLDVFRETVPEGETWTQPHQVSPPAGFTGSDLRLTYLLYKGDPPASPSADDVYRSLNIVVDVTDNSSTIVTRDRTNSDYAGREVITKSNPVGKTHDRSD